MAKTVLIAEDEPSLLNMLSKKIQSLGYKVVVATDGDQAIAQVKTHKPDLILLDIIMPKKNGLKVLQELRVNLQNQTPVIVLSNLEKAADIEAGKSLGIQDYIIKSNISIRDLANRIAKVLAQDGAV